MREVSSHAQAGRSMANQGVRSLHAQLLSSLRRRRRNQALPSGSAIRRFWRAFTAEEIAESERIAAERGGLFAAWKKKRGDGYFLPEAFLPEHRRQRFMGELPHQWVEIYHSCECSEFIQYWIKFSDGIAIECGTKQPALGQGFFDDASEFDL